MEDNKIIYKKAREARKQGNNDLSYKYYKEIYDNSPKEWEAKFYVTYFEAMSSSINNLWSASVNVINIEREIFKYLKGEKNIEDEEGVISSIYEGIYEISKKFTSDIREQFTKVDTTTRNLFISEYVGILSVAAEMLYSIGDDLEATFGNKYYSYAVSAWKEAIKINSTYLKYVIKKEQHYVNIEKYVTKINELEPNYKVPYTKETEEKGSSFMSKFKKIKKIFK